MKKKPLLVAASAIALVLASCSLRAQDWSSVTSQAAPSVVRLQSQGGKDGGICSAVVIAKELVVTNAHCIPEGKDRSFAVGKNDAELIRFNRILDLAILRVDGLDAAPLELSTKDLQAGLPVAAAGYALGSKNIRFQYGHVSDVIGEPEIFPGPMQDMALFPGDSGGALLDMDGKVLTLNRGTFGRALELIGLVIPLGNAYAVGVDQATFRKFVKAYLPPAPKPTRRRP